MQASAIYRFLSLGVGAFFVLLVDLVTKIWFFGYQAPIVGSFIRFERHENHGLSFNLPVPIFIPLLIASVAITAALVYVKREGARLSTLSTIALVLFIGGTLGNAFDRFTLGYVRDWIAIYRLIFNLADVFILVGLGYLFFTAQINKKTSS